jgi:hypothetical protein
MSAPFHLIFGTFLIAVAPAEAPKPFPGVESRWEGFVRHDFRVDEAAVIVVEPRKPLSGRPWAWRGEFFGLTDPRPIVEFFEKVRVKG